MSNHDPMNGVGMHTLTPITTTESSPPDKMPSPRSAKRSFDEMQGLVQVRSSLHHGGRLGAVVSVASSSEDSTLDMAAMTVAGKATSGGRSSINNLNNVVIEASTLTPMHTPPEQRLQARPGPGEVKGCKLTYDPEVDSKLDSKEKKKYRPRYKDFGVEMDNDKPPPDPRLAMPVADYEAGKFSKGKARRRVAPYTVRPYGFDPKTSIGRGPATKIVVYGFDPLSSESKIRVMLGQFGDISEFTNMTDPNTGSFLGVCSVTFKDRIPLRGSASAVRAADAARRAEKEGSGQRIDQKPIRVERDPAGLRSRRYAERAIRARKAEMDKLRKEEQLRQPRLAVTVTAVKPTTTTLAATAATATTATTTTTTTSTLASPATTTTTATATATAVTSATSIPPPDAPKGPSGKPPPQGPRAQPPKPVSYSLIEPDPILPKIKRKPYIFLAHCYVPVLGTTVRHLQNRMKMYDWRAVRCDRTGYYVIFDDSKRGEDEASRCYRECHMQPLFTYCMNMECQQYGNPNYVRSPTPERAAAEQAIKSERKRIKEEDEKDFELEKKERAENLDPARAALDLLIPQLRDIIVSDLKTKIATPALYNHLDPANHVEKRRKHGIADPVNHDTQTPFQLTRADDTLSVGTPDSRTNYSGGYRKSLARLDKFRNRRDELARPVNAFADERRKRPAPSRRPIQSLHRRLQDFFESEDESEDERRTSITRGSEEQESRAISEVSRSPARFDMDEDGRLTPRPKRRRTEAGWGAESDDDSMDIIARKSLGHLIDKEPEDMAVRELEQMLAVMPRSSKLHKRALTEIKLRHKAEEDDELFFGKVRPRDEGAETPTASSAVDIMIGDADSIDQTTATPEPIQPPVKTTKKKAAPKPKKKTKKQLLLEEQEAAKLEHVKTEHYVESIDEAPTPALEVEIPLEEEEEAEEEEEERAEVEWGVSTTVPRRTVEDDPEVVLDVDGWQHAVKDDEDVMFLKLALKNLKAANLGDVDLWAYHQKEIKALNNGGIRGIVREEPSIVGYYLSNPTGCARTEGYHKILESEKSKYLPHRIRVQKAREEREAQAKKDPALATEIAKATAAAAKVVSIVSSRSNRATNRRLVNDINTSKQNLGIDTDTIRFNQLKKRKKLVKFDRSAIHNWGLYAEENIAMNDMIIEYVGEKVRQRVADLREQTYQKQGIGSSYLFRIDEDTVIDATKKGGIARFINHSCTPNCTAKIIKVDGTKRIVIYALRDINKNEELTYDYKFEREINSDDRIPCLCGSVGCKGFLN